MKKSFWLRLCLINLCIVALFGFMLRSKILFSLPFIDYRSLLSAHSHFAFSGWVGLSLMTLLIYTLPPADVHSRKIYQWILAGIEVSSLGMALFFPVVGYNAISITFSSLYIVVTYLFGYIFIRDIIKGQLYKTVKMLAVAAIIFLLISAVGPLGLSYILISQSGNSILYRDSIYTFLHFQYNGFFTVSIFALYVHRLIQSNISIGKNVRYFAILLVASVIPALFLSLLWHNSILFYILAFVGCLLILLTLMYFLAQGSVFGSQRTFSISFARSLLTLSLLSFVLKMLLNAGTVIPQLSNAVYGDRPVIIGFLHLVFLGFVTFFILSNIVEEKLYPVGNMIAKMPIIIFSTGIICNELLLMTQGLGVLFKTNSSIYNWLLWGASILLFIGALLIAITYSRLYNRQIALHPHRYIA